MINNFTSMSYSHCCDSHMHLIQWKIEYLMHFKWVWGSHSMALYIFRETEIHSRNIIIWSGLWIFVRNLKWWISSRTFHLLWRSENLTMWRTILSNSVHRWCYHSHAFYLNLLMVNIVNWNWVTQKNSKQKKLRMRSCYVQLNSLIHELISPRFLTKQSRLHISIVHAHFALYVDI